VTLSSYDAARHTKCLSYDIRQTDKTSCSLSEEKEKEGLRKIFIKKDFDYIMDDNIVINKV